MTKLEIINNAQMKCGLPLVEDISEADYNAIHVYDGVVEEVLCAAHWNFARRYATCEEVENQRSFGFRYAYKLPADFVHIIDVRKTANMNAPAGDHETTGKILYCNMRPAHVRYIALTPEKDWPANFADAVSTLIAARIAALSAEKMAMVPQLMQLYNLSLSTAQAIDSRESRSRIPQDNPFMAARQQVRQG